MRTDLVRRLWSRVEPGHKAPGQHKRRQRLPDIRSVPVIYERYVKRAFSLRRSGGFVWGFRRVARGRLSMSEARPLVQQIVTFMQTKTPPVANAETLEILEFMDAAQRSLQEGGRAMKLAR